jgi:hypothetical protein
VALLLQVCYYTPVFGRCIICSDYSFGFFADQLNEIRKTSLAGVFCFNSDGIKNIQPLTFRPISEM